MTAREIADRIDKRYRAVAAFGDGWQSAYDSTVNDIAEAYREGMMMVLEKFQRCSKEILAEIRAEAEKEKPDAE